MSAKINVDDPTLDSCGDLHIFVLSVVQLICYLLGIFGRKKNADQLLIFIDCTNYRDFYFQNVYIATINKLFHYSVLDNSR